MRKGERVLGVHHSKIVWERVVADSKWSSLLLSPRLAAESAFKSWGRLVAWRIDRDKLAARASDSEETAALLDWSDRFADVCAGKGWLPEALIPTRLTLMDTSPSISHLATYGGAWLPQQEAVFERLISLGVRVERLQPPPQSTSERVMACDTAQDEIRSAAVWARDQLANGAASVAVAIPNLEEQSTKVRRVFADLFAQRTRVLDSMSSPASDRSQQESSFSLGSTHELAAFPLVRGALDLLHLAGGRADSAVVGLVLRSPYLSGSRTEASERSLADRKLRSDKREHYDLPALGRLAASAQCKLLAAALEEAGRVRVGAPSRTLPSAYAEQFISVWKSFGWPGERSLDSDEQQIASRLQASLAEFGSLDDIVGTLGYASALRAFEEILRATRFEPRSAPSPISLIDVDDVDDTQFDALWVAGMDESRWPPPPSPDAFIPIDLQVAAGMPFATARAMRERARTQFEGLRSAASRVVFSWARRDEDIELQPSPWLRDLPAESQTAAPNETLALRIFASKPTLDVLTERTAPAYRRGRARGGARLFELQSQCPFRAYGEIRLGAKRLDSLSPSIDARDRGILIHAALATLWEQLRSSDGLRLVSDEQLVSKVRTLVAQHGAPLFEGASPHRVRMLQIEQELAVERILKLLEIDRQRVPFQVVGRPEMKEQAAIGALEFELRLDRVDELTGANAGQRIIVDYKTGAKMSTKGWLRDRPEQPQLPLYAVTHSESLAAVAFASVSAASVGYHGVARESGLLPDVEPFKEKDLPAPYVEWAGVLEFWRSIIERLAREFVSGDARVDPLTSACRYCHLSTLCRIHEQGALIDSDEDTMDEGSS